MLFQCWASVEDGDPTLGECLVFAGNGPTIIDLKSSIQSYQHAACINSCHAEDLLVFVVN